MLLSQNPFCGCCGNPNDGLDANFCARCLPHIKPFKKAWGDLQPWERTYFAQHGQDCPFQAEDKAYSDGSEE
jgi:predicted amidophosphoribosyltransferase